MFFFQKYETYLSFFLSENFQFLEIKFSIHLNRRVSVPASMDLFWAAESILTSTLLLFCLNRPELTDKAENKMLTLFYFSDNAFKDYTYVKSSSPQTSTEHFLYMILTKRYIHGLNNEFDCKNVHILPKRLLSLVSKRTSRF